MNFKYIILFCFAIMVCSCEDIIDVDVAESDPILVVDAWITDEVRDQKIVLSLSQEFFDPNATPRLSNATISLSSSSGDSFEFSHAENGEYIWQSNGASLGSIGDRFTLEIDWENTKYTGISELLRVPEIDSISQEFRTDELFGDDGIYCQFFARDPQGQGDAYWIKTFKNGNFLNRPIEMNISVDGAFDGGSGIDGLIFIPPVRELVNPVDDELLVIPWEPGEEIRVEIHAISRDAFRFLEIARDQMTNGLNGIFSLPLANTRSNIVSSDGTNVLGYFNVASVTSAQEIIE